MDIVLLSIGGASGSILRYILGNITTKKSKNYFPYATFFINISGAILLGIINGFNISGNAYILLADGFLGAYTTFSTFMYEGFCLFENDKKQTALIYISGSLILGVLGFFTGQVTGSIIQNYISK